MKVQTFSGISTADVWDNDANDQGYSLLYSTVCKIA